MVVTIERLVTGLPGVCPQCGHGDQAGMQALQVGAEIIITCYACLARSLVAIHEAGIIVEIAEGDA